MTHTKPSEEATLLVYPAWWSCLACTRRSMSQVSIADYTDQEFPGEPSQGSMGATHPGTSKVSQGLRSTGGSLCPGIARRGQLATPWQVAPGQGIMGLHMQEYPRTWTALRAPGLLSLETCEQGRLYSQQLLRSHLLQYAPCTSILHHA